MEDGRWKMEREEKSEGLGDFFLKGTDVVREELTCPSVSGYFFKPNLTKTELNFQSKPKLIYNWFTRQFSILSLLAAAYQIRESV